MDANELFENLPQVYDGYFLTIGKNEVDDIFIGYGTPVDGVGNYDFIHSVTAATLSEGLQKMQQWIRDGVCDYE